MSRLPVSIRLGPQYEIMLIVVLGSETESTDGDVRADEALILGLVNQLALARRALETSPIIARLLSSRSRSSTSEESTPGSCAIDESNGLRHRLFRFLRSPLLGVLFEDFEAHWTPVSATQRTEQRLASPSVVFEAAGETVGMDLASTTIPTV